MRTRKVYLLKDESFAAAQTKVIDVNIVDPISSIDIIVEMTNGAAMTEASVVKPHDEFVKIELVDGSDVLASGSMEEFQALNFAEMFDMPYMELTLGNGAVQKEVCTIFFGLGRNDPSHYLVPSKYNNLQLRIQNTFTTAAATSWAATGHVLSIVANVIEEGAGADEGFLMAKEIYAYTAVDGAVETIDMPRDYPYRMIVLQALKTAYSPISSLEKIKISIDADKYVPVDIDSDHLIFDNAQLFGRAIQSLKKRITGAGVIYGDLYHLVEAELNQDTSASVVGLVTVAGEAVTMEVLIGAAGVNTVSAVEGVVTALLSGLAPHSCLYVPFESLWNPADWLRASQYGDIKLKLTGESALGAIKVFLQQLRS